MRYRSRNIPLTVIDLDAEMVAHPQYDPKDPDSVYRLNEAWTFANARVEANYQAALTNKTLSRVIVDGTGTNIERQVSARSHSRRVARPKRTPSPRVDRRRRLQRRTQYPPSPCFEPLSHACIASVARASCPPQVRRMKEARAAGWFVKVLYVRVPVKTAIQRAMLRTRRGVCTRARDSR